MQYAAVPPISTDPHSSNLGFIGHKMLHLAALSGPCATGEWLVVML